MRYSGLQGLDQGEKRLSLSPTSLQGLSFITFICYVVSSASAFLTVPLLEFLLALYFLFADAMQLNDKWQGLCWPMMVRTRGTKREGWAVMIFIAEHPYKESRVLHFSRALSSENWRDSLQLVVFT